MAKSWNWKDRHKRKKTSVFGIRERARSIAERDNLKDFVGSLSWLDGFKKRGRICYRKSTRVAQKVKPGSDVLVKDFQDKFFQLIEANQYAKEAIVNVDETGICFDSPSNYSLDFQVNYEF